MHQLHDRGVFDGQPSSNLLIYYSGILGFGRKGETFKNAKAFAPTLSQLLYIQRLLFLEYALPRKTYNFLGIKRRSRDQQLAQLNTIRLHYMMVEQMFPFGELQSLRDYGRSIARADASSFMFLLER